MQKGTRIEALFFSGQGQGCGGDSSTTLFFIALTFSFLDLFMSLEVVELVRLGRISKGRRRLK